MWSQINIPTNAKSYNNNNNMSSITNLDVWQVLWDAFIWLQEYVVRNFFSVAAGMIIALYIHQNLKPIVIKALLGQENNFLAHQRGLLWFIYMGTRRIYMYIYICEHMYIHLSRIYIYTYTHISM